MYVFSLNLQHYHVVCIIYMMQDNGFCLHLCINLLFSLSSPTRGTQFAMHSFLWLLPFALPVPRRCQRLCVACMHNLELSWLLQTPDFFAQGMQANWVVSSHSVHFQLSPEAITHIYGILLILCPLILLPTFSFLCGHPTHPNCHRAMFRVCCFWGSFFTICYIFHVETAEPAGSLCCTHLLSTTTFKDTRQVMQVLAQGCLLPCCPLYL